MKAFKLMTAMLVLLVAQFTCCGITIPPVTPTPPGIEPPVNVPPEENAIGTISRVHTRVQAGPSTNLKDVSGTQDLNDNDAVRVTNGGIAQLDFQNQISFKLFNDTAVGGVSAEISPNVPTRIKLKLQRGGLSGQVVESGGQFDIEIANGATISILGTQFFVEHDQTTGITAAGNFDGQVEFTVPGGSPVVLDAGTLIDIYPSGEVQFFALPFDRATFEEQAAADSSALQALINLREQYQIPIPEEYTAPQPQPSASLQVWVVNDARYNDSFVRELDNYQAANPGVTIDWQFLDNMAETLYTAAAAGVGPDVVIWEHYQIGRLAQNGVIYPLDKLNVYVDELSQFEPAPAQGMMWQGSIWGFPLSEDGVALIYNRDLLTNQYFPANQWDFNGLYDAAKLYALDHPNGEFYNYLFCNPGLGFKGPGQSYFVAPILLGAGYPDNLGVPGYIDEYGGIYLSYPSVVAGGNFISDLRSVTWSDSDYASCNALFMERQTAAFWTGPWEIGNIQNAGIDIGVLGMGRPFIVAKTAMLTTIGVQRGNGDDSLALIRWLAGQDAAQRYASTGQIIPARSDAQKMTGGIIYEFGEALRNGVAQPNAPFEDTPWSPVDDAIRNIWDGGSPDTALKYAESQIIISP